MSDFYKTAFLTLVRFPPKHSFTSVEQAVDYVRQIQSSKVCRERINKDAGRFK